MLARLHLLARRYLPLRFSEHDSPAGPRIGGMPPVAAQPRHVDRRTRYLATLPLDDSADIEVSLFLSFEPGTDHSRSAPRTSRILHGSDNTLVEAVVHRCSPRASSSDISAPPDMPSRGLIIGEPTIEPIDEDDPVFSGFDGDKMGGIPRYDQNKDPLYTDAQRAMDIGYVHLLQLDSQGMLESWMSWPFLNAVFHVWARQTAEGMYDFKFGWA